MQGKMLGKMPVKWLVFILGWISITHAYALGQLTVAPTRVVFEDSGRSAKLTLVNTGDESITYRMSWTRKHVTEDGKYEAIEVAREGERFADPMVRFSPRQVVLPPGQPQVVRLMLNKPAALETGEYRSYLTFTAIPQEANDQNGTATAGSQVGISINLIPIMAISIPVIVRHGELNVDVKLTDLTLKTLAVNSSQQVLALNIERNGNQSVYGDFSVEFVAEDGKRYVAGQVNGLAAYPPQPRRYVELPLYPPAGVKLRQGELRVIYRAQPDDGGKELAEAQLRLP